jgi:hypothetical protein
MKPATCGGLPRLTGRPSAGLLYCVYGWESWAPVPWRIDTHAVSRNHSLHGVLDQEFAFFQFPDMNQFRLGAASGSGQIIDLLLKLLVFYKQTPEFTVFLNQDLFYALIFHA